MFVTILTIIQVMIALLLTGIILIQQSKSGGGLGAVGGGVTETVFGAGAGNVLTKATVILAAFFLCMTLLLAIITGHQNEATSVIETLPDESVAVETVKNTDAKSEDKAEATVEKPTSDSLPEVPEKATAEVDKAKTLNTPETKTPSTPAATPAPSK